jgi:uncharacterized protein involved in exopolysaccharide biosynthesis
MRKSSKLFVAVAAAGLVAAGGSAFTASNSLPANDSGSVGYGATTVTGVSVSNISYNADTVDGSKLASVVVTSTDLTNAPGTTGTLTLRNSLDDVLTTEDCGTAVVDNATTPTKYTYTCTLTPQVNASDVKTVGFTATGASA